MTLQIGSLEKRVGSALGESLGKFFQSFGGSEIRGVKFLPRPESQRLLDNWPRFGFSCDRGYVPIAEDVNGDLFCVACAAPWHGQVFHLAWDGDETARFESLQAFVQRMRTS